MRHRVRAVHHGADGSVHLLSSTLEGSLLIITDPKLGRDDIRFDGPCRLIPRSPNLPADYDAVEYQSISRTGSTRVTVHPGKPAFLHSISGVCWSCMFGEHDWLVWPVCPGEAAPEPVPAPGTATESATRAATQSQPEKPKRRPRVRWLGGEPLLNDPLPANVNASVNAPAPGEMMPVPTATEPDVTNLADIDGPSWGPSTGYGW